MDGKAIFTVHLAAYGDHPRPCELLEDDGTTFDYELGKWAILTVTPDGKLLRLDHGQLSRYQIKGVATDPAALLEKIWQ